MSMIHRHKVQRAAKKPPTVTNENVTELEAKKTTEKESENMSYTKTDINRMSKEDLVVLAVKVGIENAEEISGSDLKKMLIDYYNL
ncbi:MAG: hypothetical protein LUI12_01865 [Clostridiales bacterium]|nr:hypothetical protein [Clostridiales bacterium]